MARIEKQRTASRNEKALKDFGNSRAILNEREFPEFLIRYLGREKFKLLNMKNQNAIEYYRRD
ncbi:MAG: hypothetical protein ACP5MG_08145 [Verrucomicrobiia bacterium]|jgi:hypothetical protein